MNSDKENRTPKANEAKKRPSMQSPYSSATPTVRPAPKKLGRPLREQGDCNLDATSVGDDTLNLTAVKMELSETYVEERLAAGVDACVENANVSQVFVKTNVVCEEVKQPNPGLTHCGDQNLDMSAFETTLTLPEPVTLPINEPVKKGSLYCRMGDPNLDETAADTTAYDMDLTQNNATANNVLKELLRVNTDRSPSPVKREPSEDGPNEDMWLPEQKTQPELSIIQKRTFAARSEPSRASVHGVVVCERADVSVEVVGGVSLANEMKELGASVDVTEVAGKVNVSELSTEEASASTDLPCVSDRPTDFSFSAAVKTSISHASLGEEEFPTGLPKESILNPADDTALIFDVAVKVDQEENETVDVTVTAEVEQVGDVTTAVDDTMMMFNVPSRKSSDFPAHFGTAEVESRPDTVEIAGTTAVSVDEEMEVELEVDSQAPEQIENERECDIKTTTEVELLSADVEAKDVEPAAPTAESAATQEPFSSSEGFKSPLSPITDLSANVARARASIGPSSSQRTSPTASQSRKYNMNDSEISFMIHEVEAYEVTARQPTPELDQLQKNLAQIEMEKADLYANLRDVLSELNVYKEKAASQESALVEANKKLNQTEQAKEYAERTVADYEFVVEDLKAKHAKQKENFQTKLIEQENEIENLRNAMRGQEDMSITTEGLTVELTVTKEQLVRTTAAKEDAEKRCDELQRELASATKSTAMLQAESDEKLAAGKQQLASLQNEIGLLHVEIREKDEELLSLKEASNIDYIKLQEKLSETALALEKSEESNEQIRRELAESIEERTQLREIQLASEQELWKIKDDLKNVTDALQVSEESRAKATLENANFLEELNSVRAEIAEKSRFIENEMAKIEDLKNKCAAFEDQLIAEKLARDVVNREMEQLRDENSTATIELERAKSALLDAEIKAAEAHKELEEHIKCHTEELNTRVGELESKITSYTAEKDSLLAKLEEQRCREIVMREEMEKADEHIAKLELELVDTKKENSKLFGELELGKELYVGKATEAENLSNEITIANTLISTLEDERDRLRRELNSLNEQLGSNKESSKKAIESLQSEVAELTAERDSLVAGLSSAEELNKKFVKDLDELKLSAFKQQTEIESIIAKKEKLEDEWKEKEDEYKKKLQATEKVMKSVPDLEQQVQQLKTESRTLSEELTEADSRLKIESEAKTKAAKALAALEEQFIGLQKAKKDVELEYETAKKQFEIEIATARKCAADLKAEIVNLENRLSQEEAIAQEKLKGVRAQLDRLEDELKESKLARDEVEAELTKFSRQSTELLAEKQSLELKLAEAMANAKALAEQGSKGNEKEIAELKRALELKTREIDRLGNLCDEFDDIEADYRQKVFSLIRERDELKAKLDPSSVKVVPVLLNALTEGVKPLTPDNSMVCGEQSAQNVNELEKKLNALKEEKMRLEKLKKVDDQELEELKERCKLQESRISSLEKICDDADACEQELRMKIGHLLKEVEELKEKKALKEESAGPSRPLQEALRERVPERVAEMEEGCEKERFGSASSSVHQKSLDKSGGGLLEESQMESAGTPNRTLYKTLYERNAFEKTQNLADTPGKANTSRCAQQ
ncbi:hypothetical protein Q1695_004917 [Nippostrongylus brasiliensis]|nr:hypothetical protein Q1695_004917 [Nippostrongylus brasiliensis]